MTISSPPGNTIYQRRQLFFCVRKIDGFGHPGSAPRPNFTTTCRSRSNRALDHHLLDLGDGLRRVEALGAGFGAVHDGVAAVEPERILELVEALAPGLVAA